MHSKTTLAGLALAFLTACATPSAPPVPPPVKLLPPQSLLAEAAEPRLLGETNEDLAQWALELLSVIRSLNSDKRALQEWANGS